MSLVTVPVRVEHGAIFSVDGTPLPEHATALLVLLPPPADSFAEQDNRTNESGNVERDNAFARFYESVYRHAQEIHLDELTDEQLNELVHSAQVAQ